MEPRARLLTITALATLMAALPGCGDGEEATLSAATTAKTTDSTEATVAEEDPSPAPLKAPPCPPVDNCERASGEIAFVEKVDPDGDGDAHFVLFSADSITGPGFSVIDVSADLRPDPLPEAGDQLSASGPVYQGSYGQSQIQADEIRFRRAGD